MKETLVTKVNIHCLCKCSYLAPSSILCTQYNQIWCLLHCVEYLSDMLLTKWIKNKHYSHISIRIFFCFLFFSQSEGFFFHFDSFYFALVGAALKVVRPEANGKKINEYFKVCFYFSFHSVNKNLKRKISLLFFCN